MTLFIGLMSGTSLDGVDGVLVAFDPLEAPQVLGHAYQPFHSALKAELLALNAPGPDELHRAALAANAVARQYAAVVEQLLQATGRRRDEITAIGAHGQTVRHRPGEFDGTGYTLQINAPALLAELTDIDVVADLRSRDVAAGGGGAPLAPTFHQRVFGRPDTVTAVLNVGGISNLSVLDASPDRRIIGFDCGPGNALMDLWCERHLMRPFDADGAWAASGVVIEPLLTSMLSDPYFGVPAPKSTGRDLFKLAWLAAHLEGVAGAAASDRGIGSPPDTRVQAAGSVDESDTGLRTSLRPADVQATLCELTARTCADAMRRYGSDAHELLVCGGGALNAELMRRLAANLPGVHVDTTSRAGIPPMQVEACAFAWLALAHVERRAGNIVSVTGASGPRVLGALYPGALAISQSNRA